MKLQDFIVCEDIRHEAGNKVSLIGTFGDQILVSHRGDDGQKWPVALRLAFYVRVSLEEKDSEPDGFELSFRQGGEVISTFNGPLKIQNRHRFINLALTVGAFPIMTPGKIDVSLKFMRDGRVLENISPGYDLTVIQGETPQSF